MDDSCTNNDSACDGQHWLLDAISGMELSEKIPSDEKLARKQKYVTKKKAVKKEKAKNKARSKIKPHGVEELADCYPEQYYMDGNEVREYSPDEIVARLEKQQMVEDAIAAQKLQAQVDAAQAEYAQRQEDSNGESSSPTPAYDRSDESTLSDIQQERNELTRLAANTLPQQKVEVSDSMFDKIMDSLKGFSDESEETGNWMSHLENLVIMAYQVSRATSFTDVFVAIVAYIKMNTQKSVVKEILQLIDKVTTAMPREEITPQAWDGATILRNWDLLKTNTVFKRVSYLLSAAMSLSVCSIKSIEFSPFGLELISVEAAKEQLKAVDVIDAAIRTFTWIAETGWQVFQQRSLKPLLYSDSKMVQFNKDCDYVLANAEQAIAGNLPEPINDFEKKVDDVLRSVSEMKEAQKTGPTALWLQTRYSQLIKIKHQIIGRHRNTAIRFAPFGVGITGSSGVGKSSLSKIVMAVALHAMGFKTDPSRIITKDMFDKFESTYTSDILGMFMDDVGNGKSQFAQVSPTDVIIKFFNNMAAQAVKAELNQKGVVFIAFKVGILTSNFVDYGVRAYTEKPEASLRRFIHTRTRVKPRFRKEGGVSLDTSHPELQDCELTKDVWELDIEECHIFEDKQGKDKYKFRILTVELENGEKVHCKNLDLDKYLSCIVALAKKHKRSQDNILNRAERFDNMKMCDRCSKPTTCCTCPPCEIVCKDMQPHALDLPSNIGNMFVDAAKLSITKYLKSWWNPLAFYDQLFGFAPLSKLATWQLEKQMKEILQETGTPLLISLTPKWLFETRVFQSTVDHFHTSAALRSIWWQAKLASATCGTAVVYGAIKRDASIAGGGLFGAWAFMCYGHLQYTARKKQMQAEYIRRRDALPVHAKQIRDGIVTKGAFVATTIVVGIKLFRMWNESRKTNDLIVSPQGISKADVEGQPGWFSYFSKTMGMSVQKSSASLSATCDQVSTAMSKNLFYATYTRLDGTSTRTNIYFPRKGIALIPKHVFYTKSDMRTEPSSILNVTVHRHENKSGGQFSFTAAFGIGAMNPKLDVVAVFVPNCPDLPNVEKWFPESKPKGQSICRMVARDGNDFLQSRVNVEYQETGHCYMDFYGGVYTTELAKAGACMAPIVSDLEHPTIVGFHIGGNTSKGIGVMQTITLEMYKELKETLCEQPSVCLSADAGIVPHAQFGRSVLASKTVHPKSVFATLPKEAYVDVLGSTKLRSCQKSQVQQSPISTSVTKHFGTQNEWGPPKLVPNWKGFNATLEHIVKPAKTFPPQLLERARQDWLAPLGVLMARHALEESVQPLTLKESIMGIPGKRFINALPMDTSMGFPVFGKKENHFEEIRDGQTLVDRIPNELIMNEVNRLVECWRNGVRGYPVTSATLKDEPTPVVKEKVRVFQASSVAMSLMIRKYFLPISRFLQLHPLQSESAVGVNAFSHQWEELMEHAEQYGKDRTIAWDYSKYDVRMNSQVTTAVWQSFIELAEVAKYSKDDLYIMRMMIADIVHPLIDYNGTLMIAYNMNTSGNNLTVNVNSTAGSLYVRMGFFHVYPDVDNVRKHVASLTYGDDYDGSVKEGFEKFNFKSFKNFLAQVDMKVTLPNKSDDEVEFMHADEADFLKRQSNYIPEIGHAIGRLDEKSIQKSLHSNLKSKEHPLTVSISCIETAMHEWFAHGREVYNDRREKMQLVCKDMKLEGIPAVEMTFDDRVEKWFDKYGA